MKGAAHGSGGQSRVSEGNGGCFCLDASHRFLCLPASCQAWQWGWGCSGGVVRPRGGAWGVTTLAPPCNVMSPSMSHPSSSDPPFYFWGLIPSGLRWAQCLATALYLLAFLTLPASEKPLTKPSLSILTDLSFSLRDLTWTGSISLNSHQHGMSLSCNSSRNLLMYSYISLAACSEAENPFIHMLILFAHFFHF